MALPLLLAGQTIAHFTGRLPAVSLKEARTARDEARALLAQGVDPRFNRREARLAASASTENSLRSVFTS